MVNTPIPIPSIHVTNILMCSISLFDLFFPSIAFYFSFFLSPCVYLSLLFILRTYQFIGASNLYTLHPFLYITVNLPPTSTLPYKEIGYKTFLSYSNVSRLLRVFPFTLSSSPIFFSVSPLFSHQTINISGCL